MCGRYVVDVSISNEEMKSIFDEVRCKVDDMHLQNPKAVLKSGQVFPTNLVPIIKADCLGQVSDSPFRHEFFPL